MALAKTVICGLCDGVGKVQEIHPEAYRIIRERAGLGLREAARIGKLEFSHLSRLERGERKSTPQIDKFYRGLMKNGNEKGQR